MRTVDIPELKDRLSTYITYARAGETVIIRDHDTAVAQLIPLASPSHTVHSLNDEDRSLVADGIMSMPTQTLDLARIRNMPKALTGNPGIQAIIDDRNESL